VGLGGKPHVLVSAVHPLPCDDFCDGFGFPVKAFGFGFILAGAEMLDAEFWGNLPELFDILFGGNNLGGDFIVGVVLWLAYVDELGHGFTGPKEVARVP
jgi:hypothetical protein